MNSAGLRKRATCLVSVLLLASLLLVACGGDDDASDGVAGDEPTATVESTASVPNGDENTSSEQEPTGVRTSEATTTPASANAIGETQTSDGLDLTLTGVEASAAETGISFELELPPFAVSSDRASLFGGFMPEDILLENVSLLDPDSTFFSIDRPHRPGDEQFQFTLVLGPVDDPEQPVSVTFAEIPLLKNNDFVRFSGPWKFRIPPELLNGEPAGNPQSVGETVEQDGVAVTVDQAQRGSNGLAVHYTVESNRERPMMPFGLGVHLILPGQPPVKPLRANPVDGGGSNPLQPGQSRQYVAEFELPENAPEEAEVKFGPYVTGNGTESSVTVQDPLGEWSTEPVTINGERIAVTEVQREDGGPLIVTVANQEPVSLASVLFHGIIESHVTVTDGQGREYSLASSSSGTRYGEDQSELAAGESTFTIEVADVDPSTVEQLTITVSQSSLLLRGPYAFDITLP